MTTRTAKVRWIGFLFAAIVCAIGARLATLAVLSSPSAKSVESPVLAIRPTQLDFGSVWEQERLVWPVDFVNDTDQPQEVKSVSGSCACQTFEPQAFTVPPHGMQRVEVALSLRQAGDEANRTGEAPFRVAIWAEVAGQQRQQEWLLTGRVKQAIRVPHQLDLGRVSNLAPEKAAFTFAIPALTKLNDLRVKPAGDIEAEVTRLPGADRAYYSLTVTPRHGVNAGVHQGNLILVPFAGDNKPLPEKTIPVRFTVGPDVQPTPDLIYTGHREPGEVHSETITLTSVSGRKFGAIQAEAIGPGLSVKPLANSVGLSTFAVEQVIQARGQEASVKFQVKLDTGETCLVSVPVISAVPRLPRPEVRK